MPKAVQNLTAFNAGELSPRIYGRVDLQKYRYGLKRCLNFVPLVQGPVTRRPGTYFVTTTKDNGYAVLRRFVYSVDQAFILEFGNLYVRFYRNYGQVVSGMSAYEVATPYETADLDALQITQSGDVLYITHPSHAPRKLSRLGNTNWTLETYSPEGGPFKRLNTDKTQTIYASAATGTVALISNFDVFTSGMVGSLFYLENISFKGIRAWEPDVEIEVGEIRHVDGRVYEAQADATRNGTTAPTHTEGQQDDGDVEWLFLHAGFGWGRITAVTNARSATMTVIQRLPEVVGPTNATYKWAKAAWSDEEGYPAAVAWFQQRLVMGGTTSQPDTLWMSEAALDTSFRAKNPGGLITAAQAVTITLAPTNGQVNAIKWMVADARGLLVGSAGGEGLVAARATQEGFGPNNAEYNPQSSYGSADVLPVQANSSILMVQRAKKKLRELNFNFDRGRYVAPDMTVLADHVTAEGSFRNPTWQQEPHAIIWIPTDDGRLLGFTYNRDEEVLGWHQHTLSGVVEACETIPAPDGSGDDLWLIVRRTVNGQTVRHIEYMTAFWDDTFNADDAFYVDSGLTYEGTAVTSVSGLGHLEGEEVAINANGATHARKTVSSGSVPLDRSATKVHVGLPFTSEIEVMPLEAGVPPGHTAQGQIVRINRLTMRLLDTIGGYFGVTRKKDRIETRAPANPMDQPVPLIGRGSVPGDMTEALPGGYDDGNTFVVGQDEPLPMTIVALIPHLSTQTK